MGSTPANASSGDGCTAVSRDIPTAGGCSLRNVRDIFRGHRRDKIIDRHRHTLCSWAALLIGTCHAVCGGRCGTDCNTGTGAAVAPYIAGGSRCGKGGALSIVYAGGA